MAEIRRLGKIMGDKEGRDAALGQNIAEFPDEARAGGSVQGRKGFIQKQDLWLEHQGARQARTLRFSTGQRAHRAVCHVGNVEPFQPRLHALVVVHWLDPTQRQPQRHIVPDRAAQE